MWLERMLSDAMEREGGLPAVLARLLCVLLILSPTAPASGADPDMVPRDWKFVSENDGVRLYHRESAGSRVPAALVHAWFSAPPSAVHAVITDYRDFPEFVPDVVQCREIDSASGVRWIYQRLHFPGPVADRHYVIRVTEHAGEPQGSRYRIEWRLENGPLPVEGISPALVPKHLSGFWELRGRDGGSRTEAVYAIHSDPGGMTPAWLVILYTDRYLRQVIEAVEGRLLSAGHRGDP
jgi:hypothetical protein